MGTFTGMGRAIKDAIISTLTTNDKTIPGAINELNSNKQDKLERNDCHSNIDDINFNGVYWCSQDYITGTMPFQDYFILISMAANSASVIHFAMPFSGLNPAKWRMYINNTWTSWRDV